MRPFTTGRLRWKQGVGFGPLARSMVDFFQKTDLRFDLRHGFPDRETGIFMIRGKGEDNFNYMDTPWTADPMLGSGLWGAWWSLVEPGADCWAGFSYHWDDQPCATQEDLPRKVLELSFSFDGLLYTRTTMTAAQFESAIRKYHLLKELFRVLDCDELVGVDGNAADVLNRRYDSSHPPYGGWCFRFAKEGTQVLIRAMEETQMPRPNTAPEFMYVQKGGRQESPRKRRGR